MCSPHAAPRAQRALHGDVVGLGAAAGEENLPRFHAEAGGHGLARGADDGLGRAPAAYSEDGLAKCSRSTRAAVSAASSATRVVAALSR